MNLKKKIGKVFTSKSVGTGPSSYERRIYRAAISQRLRKTGLSVVPFFVIPDDKVLKKKRNVRYNRNVLPSESVRILSTNFSTKIVGYYSRLVYSRILQTNHSRMETFNYHIAWPGVITYRGRQTTNMQCRQRLQAQENVLNTRKRTNTRHLQVIRKR